jgi:DNA-binding NarL/FixJ family response regulator
MINLFSSNRNIINHIQKGCKVELVDVLAQTQNVLVWDISNGDAHFDNLEQYIQYNSEAKILIITSHPDFLEGKQYLALGAKGYGNAFMDKEQFKQAISVIENEKVWIYPEFMQFIITQHIAPLVSKNSEIKNLSPKEKEVSDMVAKGLSNRDIASSMGITERTVKSHLTHIFEKTGATSRLSLALLYK